MQTFVFEGVARHYGLTRDRTGANLPSEFGPWRLDKEIDLQAGESRVALNVNSALADIMAKGWHVNKVVTRVEVGSGDGKVLFNK